jgi:SagB-type dehydrogenase family enzyme
MPAKLAPIASLYHENSKITPTTANPLLESIQAFASDEDLVLRSISGHKVYPTSQRVPLREFKRAALPNVSLRDVLKRRRTIRSYKNEPLTANAVAALFQAACGVTEKLSVSEYPGTVQPVRSYPSGGALFPVELYLVADRIQGLSPASYHYNAVDNCLELVGAAAQDNLLPHILMDGVTGKPAATLILSVRWDHTIRKYAERGYRIALLEAGHMAQNILLAGCALGLGLCPVAGFHDDAVNEFLELNIAEESVIYIILAGRPGRS